MSHQIELEDLQSWLEDGQLVLFASSSKDQKRLYATIKGGFEVHSKGEVVWRGMQPFQAVEKYNKI